MRFEVDPENMAIIVELEDADGDVRLDGPDRLGDQILAAATAEMGRCHLEGTAPSGAPWAKLRSTTIQEKGHDTIGIKTGSMLDPSKFLYGPTNVEAKSAEWSYPRGPDFGKAQGFHLGRQGREGRWVQAPRPLIGWTADAKATAQRLVAEARQPAAGDAATDPPMNTVAVVDQGQGDPIQEAERFFAAANEPTWGFEG